MNRSCLKKEKKHCDTELAYFCSSLISIDFFYRFFFKPEFAKTDALSPNGFVNQNKNLFLIISEKKFFYRKFFKQII